MNRRFILLFVIYTMATLLSVAGVFAFVLPAGDLSLPRIESPSENIPTQIMPERLVALFDLEQLPQPVSDSSSSQVKADPFEPFKSYRLAGVIESDGMSIVMLNNATETATLGIGDRLLGAELIDITPSTATIMLNNETYVFQLAGDR